MELSFKSDHQEYSPGFVCKRIDFDNFLLNKALAFPEISFEEGILINNISRNKDIVILKDRSGNIVAETRLVLFAAGADRTLIRQLNSAFPDPADDGMGVRGYFENVTGSDNTHAIEIHFLKELLPWYFWIFPFSDGSANVGLAMQGKQAKKVPVSLKDLLFRLIGTYPHLQQRFINAKLTGKIEANRLPVYSGKFPVAGDNYLLLGDAARLIDPFTGEGIGNAMMSGQWAAEIAEECVAKKEFGSSVTQLYQEKVFAGLGPELELSLKLQGLARRKILLNLVIGRASKNKNLRDSISEMLYSPDAMRQLNNPLFYLKLITGK